MKKLFLSTLLLFFVSGIMAQVIGRVDKRTKDFFIPSDLKIEYRLFGYEYPNNKGQKMICFSSHAGDVSANYNGCVLGAYYDTGRMKIGDKISYVSSAGSFARMLFISATGKKAIFYLPKSSFVIK